MFLLLQTLPDLVIALAKAEQAHTEAAASMKELREMVQKFISTDDPRDKKDFYRPR